MRYEPNTYKKEDDIARNWEEAPDWDFSKIPIIFSGRVERLQMQPPCCLRPIETKPKVEPGNDPLEHNADRIAERVMRMPDAGITSMAAPPQLNCPPGDQKQELIMKPTRARSNLWRYPGHRAGRAAFARSAVRRRDPF
jgi:hypothetical protein